jgi:hypothetical protein
MALGLTQPLTEMSTRDLPGGKRRPSHKADNLSPSVSRLSRENVGASTSHNLMSLHDMLCSLCVSVSVCLCIPMNFLRP